MKKKIKEENIKTPIFAKAGSRPYREVIGIVAKIQSKVEEFNKKRESSVSPAY